MGGSKGEVKSRHSEPASIWGLGVTMTSYSWWPTANLSKSGVGAKLVGAAHSWGGACVRTVLKCKQLERTARARTPATAALQVGPASSFRGRLREGAGRRAAILLKRE